MLPELPSGSLTRAIELLDHARIVRLRDDTLELAHDSLAAIIDQKRTSEQRQLQELRRRLTNAHEEFQKTGLHLNSKQIASFEEYLPKLQLSEELLGFIRKSEDFIKREKEAEQKREREVHEAKQHKKLARTRGTLLTLATIFAAVAVMLFFRSQKNLNESRIAHGKLSLEEKTTKSQRDSIGNILLQVNQLVERLDSIDRGEMQFSTTLPTASEMEVEIQKTRITLKSLVSSDTISPQNYASASVFGTAAAPINNLQSASASSEFAMGQDVYAYALVSTPKLNEWLQVKWFLIDQTPEEPASTRKTEKNQAPEESASNRKTEKIVGNVSYLKVSRNAEGQPTLVGGSAKFQNPGSYTVRLYNSAGLEIASSKFNVSAQQAPQVHIRPGNLKLCTSVSSHQCVGETIRFSPSSTVYYHIKVHSPNESDRVKVVIQYPDGSTWDRDHDIGKNMDDGFTVWSYKRFDPRGSYRVQILNSQGVAIAETRFVVE
jgi:hypothetical protein